MSHQKELKRRQELELETEKLKETVETLKNEKAEGFELNDKVLELIFSLW